MYLYSLSSKTDSIIEYSMLKLSGNISFQVSNINHDDKHYFKVIYTFMKNAGN